MLDLRVARAAALFCAPINAGPMDKAAVVAAIACAVREHHGVRGCAGDVAYEFGEHPEVATARMRWARATVAEAFPRGEVVWSRAVTS